ncbi:MAG: hypothetical protein P8R39_11360 [Alphaproteobacteria bacterium]|nr:hypothetical protein [Alphaproteobacteria bacterium]
MGNKSPEIETLMQRLSHIIRSALEFFVQKKPIYDPELDMLFRKILPDEYQGEIDLPSADIVAKAATPGGRLAAGKLHQLDDSRRIIHEAIESEDPMRMREVANDMAREALGLSRLKLLTKTKFRANDGTIRRSKSGGRLRALAMRGFEATQDKESFDAASLYKDSDNYDYDEFDGNFEEGYDFFDGANDVFSELEDRGFSVSDVPAEYTGEIANSVEILDVLNRLDEEFRLAGRDLSQRFFNMENANIDGLRNPFNRYKKYQLPKVRKAMAKANAKRARQESKALEEASDKKKPATRSIPDDAAKSPRAMSTRELISKYNSMEPSTERTRISKEIKRMAASEPEVSGVKIGKEVKRLRIDDLTDMVQNGTAKQASQALAELARRSDGKVPSFAYKKPKQPEVRAAVSREVEDTTGTSSDTNPFPAARAQLRNILEQMTHRDAEVDGVMKTVTYRLFNLSGLSVHGTPEDMNVITESHVRNMTGTTATDAADSTASEESIRVLQGQMRKLAATIQRMNSGSENEGAVVSELVEIISSSPAISDQAFLESTEFRGSNAISNALIEGSPEGAKFVENLRAQVAYVLNGLITGPQARKKLELLTHYGDMFADAAPEKSIHDMLYHSRTAPSHVAADYFNQAIEKMSVGRRAAMQRYIDGHGKNPDGSARPFYHATPNGIALDKDKNPILNPSESGQQGDGIYLSVNPRIVEEVYANNPTHQSLRGMFNADEIGGVDELIDQRMDAVSNIRYLSEMIATHERGVSPLDMLGDSAEIEMGINRELIQDLKADLEGRADLLEFIDDELEVLTGTRVSPDVLPVVVNAKKSFNAHSGSIYSKEDPEILDILDRLSDEPGVNADAVDAFYEGLPETFSGDEFYGGMATRYGGEPVEMNGVTNLMARMAGEVDPSGVTRNDFNEILRGLGYDSIYAETTNAGTNLIPVSHDTLVVFESNNVKHIDADNFDGDEPYLYKSNISAPEFFPSAGIVNGALETTGSPDYRGAGTTWASAIEESGHPASVSKVMQQMLAGRVPEDADAQQLFKQMLPQIRTNARRLRDSGAHWIADFLQPSSGAGMFEKLDVATAQTLMPIYKVLNDLPGANNAAKRFARSANPFKKAIPAHAEIVSAIRRGDPSSLSPEQKVAYDALKGAFEETLKRLRAAGVIVGDVGPNFFPQVYDVDMIARNKDGFINWLAKYFDKEGRLEGRPVTLDEAKDIASRVVHRLTNDDGIYMPPKAETAGENADHIDHTRLIQLHKLDADGKLVYEEELKGLEEFLVNDPETIIGKYHLASERRLMLTERFGINMHGFKDYLALAAHGPDALTKLLSTDKVITVNRTGINEEGKFDVSEQRVLSRKPFPNEAAAAQVSSELIALARQGRHDDVARILDSIKPDGTETWQKRSEAIKQALRDFGGRRTGMHHGEIEFMENMFRMMNNKSAPGHNAGMHAFSKNAKALGNIMYLGFTTLTSTTDVVLPLIRTGQFGTWVKGISRYATDPTHRDAMKNAGMTMGNMLHGHLANLYGSTSGKYSTAFFNATGLTPWTNVMRNVAGSVALEFLRAEARTMHKRAGRPNRAYRMAKKRLEHYGLQEYGNPNARLSLESSEALDDPRVSEALVKFAGETIFAPNRNDIPLWAQTPVGELMFHLKSFPLMMGRMSRDIMENAYTYVRSGGKDGDIKPLFFMMTAAPAMGTGTLGMKDIIQSRGGDDERSPEFRERTFEKLAANFGFESKVRGKIATPFGDAPADEFLGWYLEGMLQLGGLGLIAELMYNTAAQADNGAWGQVRVLSNIFGPTFGHIPSALNVFAGVTDQTASNYKERQAVREVASRIPVLGGVRAAREGAVDAIAGEKKKRRSKSSNGWVSKNNSGWKASGW